MQTEEMLVDLQAILKKIYEQAGVYRQQLALSEKTCQERNAVISDLNAEISRRNNELKALEKNYLEQLTEASKNDNTKIIELTQKYNQAISELRAEHAQELAQKETDFQAQLQEFRGYMSNVQAVAAVEARLNNAEKTIDEERKQLRNQSEEVKTFADILNEREQKIKENEDKIKEWDSLKEKQLKQLAEEKRLNDEIDKYIIANNGLNEQVKKLNANDKSTEYQLELNKKDKYIKELVDSVNANNTEKAGLEAANKKLDDEKKALDQQLKELGKVLEMYRASENASESDEPTKPVVSSEEKATLETEYDMLVNRD